MNSETENTVSILIPTFRRPERLKRAIQSARAQTYPDIIIRIFDNASGDETSGVVSSIIAADPRVQYCCQEKNVGMIANCNYALNSVTTKYFAFLNDDDVLLPECILHAMRGLKENPGVVFWGGGTMHVDEASGRILRGPNRAWKKGGVYTSAEACRRICHGDNLDFQGLVFRAEWVRSHSVNFLESVMITDVHMELQLAKHYPIGVTPSATAIMYAHGDSISSGVKSVSTFWPALGIIAKEFSRDNPLPSSVVDRCLRAFQRFTIERLWHIAIENSRAGKYDEAFESARILKKEFPDSVLSRIAQWSIGVGKKHWALLAASLFFRVFVRIVMNPSILLNRFFLGKEQPRY